MGCSCSKELPLEHNDFAQENDLPSFQIPLPSTSEDQQPTGREERGESNGVGGADGQGNNVEFVNSTNMDSNYVNVATRDPGNANGKSENNDPHSVIPSELSNSISTMDLNNPDADEDKESHSSRASSVVSISQCCEESNSSTVEDHQIAFMRSFYSTQFSTSQNKDKLLEELVNELNAVAENRDWETVSPVLLKLYSIVFYEKTPYGNSWFPSLIQFFVSSSL